MLENRIESILNNSASFGKINAILYFKLLQINFEVICNNIIKLFNPDEINCSLFDLESMEMEDIEFASLSNQNNNDAILKIVLFKEEETIIIEYYQNQIIIEHIFTPSNINIVKGYSVIEKYHKEKRDSILVIGFELSIHINSYDLSLDCNVTDNSSHPIFVLKNDRLFEQYDSDNSYVNEQKKEIMREYLRLIGNVIN